MQNINWIQRWAGSYTFISCSYWAPQYHYTLQRILGKGFDNVLFIHKKGAVTFLVRKDELDSLGNYLACKTRANEKEAIVLLNKLKQNTDLILKVMKDLNGRIPTKQEYKKFFKIFERHLAYHNFMKKTVDYLPREILSKLLPYFKEARVYSEPVYSKSEEFFRELAKEISKKEKYGANLLTCLTQTELESYIENRDLPNPKVLEERYIKSALIFEDKKLRILTGNELNQIENKLFGKNVDELRGNIAFKGKVKGIGRIIYDPHIDHVFNKGDILITGMTRPEFMPFIEKAGAIVTDVGGVLCHAAIIAREMKIPCVVGTERATKVFQDGESIEVDAYNGIVRRMK